MRRHIFHFKNNIISKVGFSCVVMIIMVVLVVSLSVFCVMMVDTMVLMVGVGVLDVVLGKIHFRFFKTKKHGFSIIGEPS